MSLTTVGSDVVANRVDEVLRGLGLRAGGRQHDHGRTRAVGAELRGQHGGDTGGGAQPVGQFVEHRRIAGGVDRQHERTVGAGAERGRRDVEGTAAGEMRRAVAGVGVAEAQAAERGGEREQHGEGDRPGRERPVHDDATPTGPHAVLAAVAADEGDLHPIEVRADDAEQRRQQRHRRHEDDQHTGDGDRSRAVEVLHAHGAQAEQRDDHGAAGEQHGAAGGVDRVHDRVVGRQTGLDGRAVPDDDEQGVVDADTDADHRHELRRPVGHHEHVREQLADGERHADAEQGDDERHAGGDHRAERDQQDHECGDQADLFGAGLGALGHLDDGAAGFDGERRCVAAQGELDQLLAERDRDLLGRGIELEGDEGDGAVG